MARAPKSENNIQVFRGSRPKADVFAANAGVGCCSSVDIQYDKLAERTRFDNGLKHLSPTGGVERYRFPAGNGFSDDKAAILAHINAIGVGAEVSVIAIPTYAYFTGFGVHVEEEEEGLTFEIVTRNGLLFPAAKVTRVVATAGESGCEITRTLTDLTPPPTGGGEDPFVPAEIEEVGPVGNLTAGQLFVDYFYRDGDGQFALEADEIIVRVATMPAGGIVSGLFDLTFAASYDVIHRAER